MKTELLVHYLNKQVKVKFLEGDMIKTADGIMTEIGDGFIKVKGEIGVIIINQENIKKVLQ